MKPRNKKERLVVSLSSRLPAISDAQVRWLKRNAIPAIGYYTKHQAWCTCCGSVFESGSKICPTCGAKLKREDSRKATDRQSYYSTIFTTYKGWQVARHYLVKRRSRKGQPTQWRIDEVVQEWIEQNGCVTLMAKNVFAPCRYIDQWVLYSPMSIKDNNSPRYSISSFSNRLCRVLPILKRNGFKRSFYECNPVDLFVALLNNPQAEILLKLKQYALLQHLVRGGRLAHFYAVKICTRQKYYIKDASVWCDYMNLLTEFGFDTHNPKYICPEDLHKAHDALVERKCREQAKKRRQEQAKIIERYEAQYSDMKRKYMSISFSNEHLKIHVLSSVREFFEEGEAMHHCVYTNKYFQKPESLVLSACDAQGKRLETVEYNIETHTVVQSRGRYNQVTPMHDSIVTLCNLKMRNYV